MLGRAALVHSLHRNLHSPHRLYSSAEARAFIERTIKENDVVVFMKGYPDAPKCRFSATVCQVLRHQGVAHFSGVNVLDDEDVRSEIKAYSAWPTVPQVFVKGGFVGGCDIILDMNQSGGAEKAP